MAAEGQEDGKNISESLKQCVKNLATAAEALQKFTSNSSSKSSTEVIKSNQPTPLEEHRKLFGFKPSTSTTPRSFYSRPGSSKRQKTSSGKIFVPVRNTWTHKVFLLASNRCIQVPTQREKFEHGLAGLGERDIVFEKDGNSDHIEKKLLESYPVLKGCGGFEFMRTTGSSKLLEVIPVPPCGYNVQYLKSVLSQAKAYVRPIQKQLSLEPVSTKVIDTDDEKIQWPKEKCLTCSAMIPINVLREHTEDCLGEESDQDGDSNSKEGLSDKATPKVVDLTQQEESSKRDDHTGQADFKDPDAMLAKLMQIFPNKSHREVQQKLAKEGTFDGAISAFLDEETEDFLKPVFETPTPASTLEGFRRHWCESSLEQKILIDRKSSKLLRDVFKLYKKGMNVRAVPDVEFKGEDGSDASGPTREYFYISMSRLASGDDNLHLFEGEEDHKVPIHCIESYDSLLFYYAGLMISHSVLHGGYPLVGLSKAAVAYIITGSFDEAVQYLTVKDIPDLEIRDMIQKIRTAETDEELRLLNSEESVINTLVTAGFVNKQLSKDNKEIACDKVMMHYALMNRKLEMDDIRRGMEIVQLPQVLCNRRELWMEVFPRANGVQVSADVLVKNLTLNFGTKDMDDSQKQSFQWCKDYVASLPESSEDEHSPTTGRFLQFVFGSPQYPTQPVYIKFNRKEKSLPDPEACMGILSIPTNAADFEEFKQKMNITISAQLEGYGRF